MDSYPEPKIAVHGVECTELHCRSAATTHCYGTPECDWALFVRMDGDLEVTPR